jgi:hypothetical protein
MLVSEREINFRITDTIQRRLAELAKNIGQLDTFELYYAFLQMQYSIERFLDANFEWIVTNVQKRKQVLHAGNVFTLKKPKMIDDDGVERSPDALFIREQIIMVEVPRYIYFIQITVPSTQTTRDLQFDELSNQWLSGLRLFDD